MQDQILFLIIGAALGVTGQLGIEWFQRRQQSSQGPNVAISKVETNGHVLVQLHNLGPDSLAEMEVEIEWLGQGHMQRQQLRNFLDPKDGTTSMVEYLGPNEYLQVGDLPEQTDDGLVSVRISGLGQRSHKMYDASSQIAVKLFGTR